MKTNAEVVSMNRARTAAGPGKPDTAKLISLLAAYAPHDGSFEMRVPGVHAGRFSRTNAGCFHALRMPSLCIAAQGAKTVIVGQETYTYDASRMIVFSVALPVASQITQASHSEPYLSLRCLGEPDKQRLCFGQDDHGKPQCARDGDYRLTGFGYDAAGNMTSNGTATYTYDAENRLTSTAGWTYVYDGEGMRVRKSNSASNGTLYWAGIGSDPLLESSLSGAATAEYIFFNGRRVARRDSNGAVHYYFSDHLGSASVITNAAGAIQEESDYFPYGGEMAITNGDPNQYKFTGKLRDTESGLDDFGARYCGSSLGRFMTPDWAARPTMVPYAVFGDPQSLNLYGYVRNDPVSSADADGHSEKCEGGGVYICSVKEPPPDPRGNNENAPAKVQNQKSWWASLTGALAVGVARISSSAMRSNWLGANPGQTVPWDSVRGRFYDMAHIKALADQGTNAGENLKPMEHGKHMAEHMQNGDFARWALRAKDALKSGAEEMGKAIESGAKDSAEAAEAAATEVAENPGEAVKDAATAVVEAVQSGEVPPI